MNPQVLAGIVTPAGYAWRRSEATLAWQLTRPAPMNGPPWTVLVMHDEELVMYRAPKILRHRLENMLWMKMREHV